MKPRTEQNNFLTLESQTEEPELNQTRLESLCLTSATAISHSRPAVTSNLHSENSGLFSSSPPAHSKGDVAIIRPSCLCSAGPAHTPSTWLMSAETDESPHVSRPRVLQQHDDDACEPLVGSCSLISARGTSTPHQQLQQTLEDMSSVEPSAVLEDVDGPLLPHRASAVSDILTEGEEQVTVCNSEWTQMAITVYIQTLRQVYIITIYSSCIVSRFETPVQQFKTSPQLNIWLNSTQLASSINLVLSSFHVSTGETLGDGNNEAFHFDWDYTAEFIVSQIKFNKIMNEITHLLPCHFLMCNSWFIKSS